MEVATRRLIDVSHVSVFGNVTIGSAAVRACLEVGIPVLWFTYGGWFAGAATAISAGSIELRQRQHRAATVGAVVIAAAMVAGKIRNGRTLLRRHSGPQAVRAVEQLAEIAAQAEAELDTGALLGLEGTAARIYFEAFARLLKGSGMGAFDFTARNRRPPRDRVNALLSFAYAMLVKDATVACLAAGLDPHVGLYHRPRFGRPSLALDLMEELKVELLRLKASHRRDECCR